MASIDKANVFNQLSIAAQIIDGSIQIESTSEFENILQIFPNDPALLRAYGDLQTAKNEPDVAAQSYGKAARLFIDSGMKKSICILSSPVPYEQQPISRWRQTVKLCTRNQHRICLRMISLALSIHLKKNNCQNHMSRPSLRQS